MVKWMGEAVAIFRDIVIQPARQSERAAPKLYVNLIETSVGLGGAVQALSSTLA